MALRINPSFTFLLKGETEIDVIRSGNVQSTLNGQVHHGEHPQKLARASCDTLAADEEFASIETDKIGPCSIVHGAHSQ